MERGDQMKLPLLILSGNSLLFLPPRPQPFMFLEFFYSFRKTKQMWIEMGREMKGDGTNFAGTEKRPGHGK